ncbi:homeobox protein LUMINIDEPENDENS [Diospyros lotus]|uniref:homeobox protein LUMINIDEPENDENS n=1 Tax=Diospyros lotus TaxID=55363 RepID=UPI00225A9090|nr:homeobox protein LUMINIDEPENDENS [Diospyros lotus]
MMEVLKENQLELALCESTASSQGLLHSQMELFRSQVDQLQNIVVTQCKLTGVNPLSQEMAAGALSIKIGKRPRDLLNPKAVNYMQSVFSVKDAITKKEFREISALFGVTVTQVREFFNNQRSKVRKFVRLSREKALRSSASEQMQDGVPMSTDLAMPIHPVPLNSLGPTGSEEKPCCSTQAETLPGLEGSDRHFVDNIFGLMRKEETFSGQVKLMEWILQVQNPSVLYWFLTKDGVMILATWLSQAATEEQTSVLHVILKVLCHLPLHKALPVHMSAILQSVNRLRFYRTPDISNRARILLCRWSKIFARSQPLKKPGTVKSSTDAQNEMLLKQSINEIMGDESWEPKVDVPEDTIAPSLEGSENFRKLESPQLLKLLPASTDDSKKLTRGVSSSQTRERRKVLLVEQPGQKSVGRNMQITRSATTSQSRPLSADDIQKAKMRAQFMQSKHGKSGASSGEGFHMKTEISSKSSSSLAKTILSASRACVSPQVEEHKDLVMLPSKDSIQQEAPVSNKMNVDPDEPLWKKCKRVQIPWLMPAEMRINEHWSVGAGENSKEVEVQRNRIRREKEINYRTLQEIPSDPREPWDREMEYDDSLTPEIPTVQLPDADGVETAVSQCENETNAVAPGPASSQNSTGSLPGPDLELLAVLLNNPQLVFALTSVQGGGNLSSEDTVKLLDMIKANGVASLTSSTVGLGRSREDNVQVSLPSPTPPSDPVPSGWRAEMGKNPFSRQRATANTETIIARQEGINPLPATAFMVQPELPPVNFMAQQRQSIPSVSDLAMAELAALPPSSTPVAPPLRQSPNMQLPPPEMVLNVRNIPGNNSSPLPNLAAAALLPSNSVRVEVESSSVYVNPAAPPSAAHPHVQAHSWGATQGLASSPSPQPNNYNAFMRGHVQPGSSRDRNDHHMGEPGFESWSPERGLARPSQQIPGWSYPESTRMNIVGHNYRSDPDRPRSRNSYGYQEYDTDRHVNKRQRDWRR